MGVDNGNMRRKESKKQITRIKEGIDFYVGLTRDSGP